MLFFERRRPELPDHLGRRRAVLVSPYRFLSGHWAPFWPGPVSSAPCLRGSTVGSRAATTQRPHQVLKQRGALPKMTLQLFYSIVWRNRSGLQVGRAPGRVRGSVRGWSGAPSASGCALGREGSQESGPTAPGCRKNTSWGPSEALPEQCRTSTGLRNNLFWAPEVFFWVPEDPLLEPRRSSSVAQ